MSGGDKLSIDYQQYNFRYVGKRGTPPLFFLHGHGLWPAAYVPFAEALLEYDAIPGIGQVVIPNQRFPHKGRHRLGSFVEQLEGNQRFIEAFMEGEEHGYALGGHSGGGPVAVEVAARVTELPFHLLLTNPAVAKNYRPVTLVARGIVGHVEESLSARSVEEHIGGNVASASYFLSNIIEASQWWRGVCDLAKLKGNVPYLGIPVTVLLTDHDRIFDFGEAEIEEMRKHFSNLHILYDEGQHNKLLRRPRATARQIAQVNRV